MLFKFTCNEHPFYLLQFDGDPFSLLFAYPV